MPIEIPPTFFPDIDRLIIKLIWKYQEKPNIRKAKTFLEEKKRTKLEVSVFPILKLTINNTNQDSVVLP